jgi:nucleolar protein 15
MMFGKRLVAKLLEPEEVHPLTFRGANKRFVPTPTRRIAIQKINREKTEDEYQKNVKRLLKKERKKRQRLKHLGIDYDFPGFCAVAPKRRIHAILDKDDGMSSDSEDDKT